MLLKVPQTHLKILALSGHDKAGFCFIEKNSAFIPTTPFNLSTKEGILAFKTAIAEHSAPDIIASDLHPDLASSKIAHEMAKMLKIKHIGIRHHHAHIAAVMAEHAASAPVLGFALDGLGLGENNELWGGELLKVEKGTYKRLGRLKPVRLPGSDKGTKEIWRIAAAFLYDKLGKKEGLPPLFETALKKHINTPFTSSCGRLFDLALALSNTPDLHAFESQATNLKPLKNGFIINENGGLIEADLTPTLLHIYNDKTNAAGYFHGALAAALFSMAAKAREATDITTIALSGGCFLNKVLKTELSALLTAANFTVLTPLRLPPSDEAVPFGMADIVRRQNS